MRQSPFANGLLSLADSDASDATHFYGNILADNIGRSVSNLGDVNNDGFDDVFVGSRFSFQAGEGYVLYGSANGLPTNLRANDLDGTDGFSIRSVAQGDDIGSVAAGLGDINGDGIDDFVISGPNKASATNTNLGPGKAYVIYGTSAGFGADFDVSELDGSNGFRILGETTLDRTAAAISSAGDVNGDGINDILIGAPNADRLDDPQGTNVGAAYVVFGRNSDYPATLDLSQLTAGTGLKILGDWLDAWRAGSSVSSAGDVNNDGFDDLLIGAPQNFNGQSGQGAGFVIYGSIQFGLLGEEPAGAGGPDFDGNGTDDILFFNEATRTVGQFSMPNATWSGIGTAGLGWQARGVGLFDGDDTSVDILWFNTQTRAVGRFDMVDGARDSWKGIGQAGVGWEVIEAGDFNGDGLDDILWFNDASNAAGQYRMDSSGTASWVGIGGTGSAWEIAGIGDFNGDDISDILWFKSSTGALGQFRMSDTGRSWVGVTGLGNGFEVAGTGDFNGDGIDDILVFNATTRALGQFDMDGGSPDWISLGTSGSGWSIAGTGDFTGDDRDDILWRHSDGRIGQYQMDGADFTWNAIGVAGSEWDVIL